jgi:hypothetical protein
MRFNVNHFRLCDASLRDDPPPLVFSCPDDRFRANFLHGRKAMLAAAAARLRDATGLVWVDLGGGTAENVDLMAEFLDLSAFQQIYIVDLCPALCEVARDKVAQRGWRNVAVVEGDACTFRPPQQAHLVTFSYSLTSEAKHTPAPSLHQGREQQTCSLFHLLGLGRRSASGCLAPIGSIGAACDR